jgi:hypothetical protein
MNQENEYDLLGAKEFKLYNHLKNKKKYDLRSNHH